MTAKRLIDLCFAIPALIATLPIQMAVAVGILVTMGRPVFFLQKRPGLHGQPFTLVKFRTMTSHVDTEHFATARVTQLGRWLRRASLDELPELINVVKGDMSLVGPRPLLMEYLSLYSPEQKRRHEVRPGLTGLVQVRGRNRLSWRKKFRYDLWYVENRSLALDLYVLWLTLRQVAGGHGVDQSDTSTMEPFRGNTAEPGRGARQKDDAKELRTSEPQMPRSRD